MSAPGGMEPRLLKAARSGNLPAIKLLGDINGVKIFRETTHHGNTCVHMASRFGKLETVQYLIDIYPPLILRSNLKGETPVHVAARAGEAEVVKLLMERARALGGSICVARIRDNHGNTPLHGAVLNDRREVVEMLMKEDRESLELVNDAGESPLSIAIDQRFFSLAKLILDRNPATLDYRGPGGKTPLHFAVLGQDPNFLLEILKIKKELILKLDDKERSPLHYAAAFDRPKMVSELLKGDPSLAYKGDQNGQAPIHLAVERGKLSILKLILDPCPDSVELVDSKKQNILHIAAKNGFHDIVLYTLKLPEMGDLVNSVDCDGNTPLHLAAMNFHSTVVYTLCGNFKVEIRANNKSGQTALETVQFSDDLGMELQQHLTLKALKRSYEKRAIDIKDILEQGRVEESGEEYYKKLDQRGRKSKEMAQTLQIMTTLIATFTFTAALTLPGGFKSDGPDAGLAMLLRKSAFQVFVIADAVAMTFSITAAVLIFWSSAQRDNRSFMNTLPLVICLTWFSLLGMALAFVTGLFVVVSHRLWLAILVCVIGGVAPAFLYVFAPFLVLVLELAAAQTFSGSRYNIIENNPFVFTFQMMKLNLLNLGQKIKYNCQCCLKPILWE